MEVVYDPFDPKPKEKQTVNVKTKTEPVVDTVSVVMITDSGEKKHEFRRMEGQGDSETWEGSWEVTDTHRNQYRAVVIANNQKGATKIEMVLR